MRDLYEIDQDLTDLIPALRRRQATHRVLEESGVNRLLDERNELLGHVALLEEML